MEKHHHHCCCCCKGAFPTEISLAKVDDVVSTKLGSLVIDKIVTKKKAKELFRKFKEKLKEELGQIDQTDIDELSNKVAEILLNLNSHIGDSTHITPAERTKWNNQFSGNYNDLTNKPNIPTVDLSNYALKSEIPDVSNLAKKSEIPDISGLAKKSEIPDISGLQPKLTAGSNIVIRDGVISALGSGGSADLSDYYTKAEVDYLLSQVSSGGSGSLLTEPYENVADVSNTVNTYEELSNG